VGIAWGPPASWTPSQSAAPLVGAEPRFRWLTRHHKRPMGPRWRRCCCEARWMTPAPSDLAFPGPGSLSGCWGPGGWFSRQAARMKKGAAAWLITAGCQRLDQGRGLARDLVAPAAAGGARTAASSAASAAADASLSHSWGTVRLKVGPAPMAASAPNRYDRPGRPCPEARLSLRQLRDGGDHAWSGAWRAAWHRNDTGNDNARTDRRVV